MVVLNYFPNQRGLGHTPALYSLIGERHATRGHAEQHTGNALVMTIFVLLEFWRTC